MKSLFVIVSVSFALCACDGLVPVAYFNVDDIPDISRTLTLPNGNGCTGKLRFTGGNYAAVHYNFLCDDGRIFFNIENAEVK